MLLSVKENKTRFISLHCLLKFCRVMNQSTFFRGCRTRRLMEQSFHMQFCGQKANVVIAMAIAITTFIAMFKFDTWSNVSTHTERDITIVILCM